MTISAVSSELVLTFAAFCLRAIHSSVLFLMNRPLTFRFVVKQGPHQSCFFNADLFNAHLEVLTGKERCIFYLSVRRVCRSWQRDLQGASGLVEERRTSPGLYWLSTY
jgi:hypothetical protein